MSLHKIYLEQQEEEWFVPSGSSSFAKSLWPGIGKWYVENYKAQWTTEYKELFSGDKDET